MGCRDGRLVTEYNFLSTVWHTGTTYFRDELEKARPSLEVYHCCEDATERARSADVVWTTYRNPYHTAASWANRGRAEFYDTWQSQWTAYIDLLELKPRILDFTRGREQHGHTFGPVPLNSQADITGAHQAVIDGDWDTYYRHVPENFISFLPERLLNQSETSAHAW